MELKHYGVKGMRWGIRKRKVGNKDGDKLAQFRANTIAANRHIKESSSKAQMWKTIMYGANDMDRERIFAHEADFIKKRLNKKYDSVIEENLKDIETGRDYIRVTLKKGDLTYVSEAEVYKIDNKKKPF